MTALWWLGSCVFITREDEALRPHLGTDLWVVVTDERGWPIPDAVGAFVDGPIARTDAAGEMVFRELGGGVDHPLMVRVDGGRFTTGYARVDPNETSVLTMSLGRRTAHAPEHPELGAAFGVDGVYSLVVPPTEEAPTIDWRWVSVGEPLGPPKQAPDGSPLDLIALLELADSGGLPLLLRFDSPDPRDFELYGFDPSEGIWLSRGEVVRRGRYLEASLPGPGWWGVGLPFEDETIPGRLVGSEISRAEVRSWAESRPGIWRQGTSSSRRFELPIPRSSAYSLGVRALDGALRYSAVVRDQPLPKLESWPDLDGDGYASDPSWGGDCDDRDDRIHPGATDDGRDEIDWNCDGRPGSDPDRDGAVADDCDPDDPEVHPGALEICDAIDNDCDGAISERDPGAPRLLVQTRDNDCAPCDPTAVIRLEPKLYWRLSSPDLGRDSSGFGRDGTVSGLEERWPGITHWSDPGERGELAPRFLGVSGHHLSLDDFDGFGTDAFSVSMWVRPEGLGIGRTMLSYALSTGSNPDCDDPPAENSRELALEFRGADLRIWIGDRYADSSKLDLRPWKWAHLVLIWSPEGGARVYLDDTAAIRFTEFRYPSGEVSGPPSRGLIPGGRLVVGQGQRCADGSDCFDRWSSFDGMIDEVAVFDRALRDSEVESLFESATCGEFPCTGIDEDGDGVSDEHIRGSFPACPAESCEEVLESGSFFGDGLYWLDYLNEGRYQQGLCRLEDGGIQETVCGDGIVDSRAVLPFPSGWLGGSSESCDQSGDPSCVRCARDTGPLEGVRSRNCREIREVLSRHGLEVPDGPYWIADPLEPEAPLLVRCLMDEAEQGGGWALAFFHQPDTGFLFVPDEDLDLLSDELETGCPGGSSPLEADTDLDGVLDGQEVLFDGTDPCDPQDRASTPGPGKVAAFPGQEANVESPFSPAYSILDRLEAFRGSKGWEFRMAWPCTGDPSLPSDDRPRIQFWRQRNDPTLAGPPRAECSPLQEESFPTGCFPGLARRPTDEVPQRAYVSRWRDDPSWAYPGQDPIGAYAAGLSSCEDYLLPANGKHIPPTGIGVGCDQTNNQSVPSVELWVRPW